MKTSFEPPYYNFIKCENIKSIEVYHKFLNWVQGEFDLCQIEEFEGLKVYYPNGCFTIKMINKKNEISNIEIIVKNKSRKIGLKTYQKIASLYDHLVNF